MTTLIPLDPFAGQGPAFNHAAATQVYQTIMKLDDDGAAMYSDIMIGSAYQYDHLTYGEQIDKALRERYSDPAIRENLIRSYISKRVAGQDVSVVLAAASELAKAFGDEPFGTITPQQRAQNAHEQLRNLVSGRFIKDHHTVKVALDNSGRALKPLRNHQAAALGVPVPTVRLTDESRSAYQQEYRQVAGFLHGYRHLAVDPATGMEPQAFVHLKYFGDPEHHITPMPLAGAPIPIDPEHRVDQVFMSQLPTNQDADNNTRARMMGLAASQQYGVGHTDEGLAHIAHFNAQRAAGDDNVPGSGLFARMNAGATFLDQSARFGPSDQSALPPKLQLALKTGQLIGTYGPEAQKIVQPVADKTAYRYRGTERPHPDHRLAAAMAAVRNDPHLDPAQKRNVMVRGTDTGDPRAPWKPSRVLSYFRDRLPSADLNKLQLSSGTVPPSMGVIINRKGQPVVESVGYGDDHYLPFNMNKLRSLKGGEYLRTRTWGGPTTEDIYTGLISGTKSLSVISHNGVYNVEFDPSFTGSRRYNDKAARMVARYGHLLDAVESSQVTTGGIHPSRLAELDIQAEQIADPIEEHTAYTRELSRLKASEERNPTFSAQQRAEAAQKFLDEKALKGRTRDGSEMTRDELIDDWVEHEAGKAALAHHAQLATEAGDDPEHPVIRSGRRPLGLYGQGVESNLTRADFKRQVAEAAGLDEADPATYAEHAVTAMGLGDEYQGFLQREQRTYAASLKPLALNGAGYEMALQALQEQFPYAIARVQFRPWTDTRNGIDTGYIKPKHNRPADVLTGYFDRSVTGAGKVTADSIRGQGSHKEPTEFKTRTERLVAANKEREEATGATGSGAARIGGPVPPAMAREYRRDADLALWRTIKGATHFSSSLNVPGETAFNGEARGKTLDQYSVDQNKVNPVMVTLRGLTESQVQAQVSTPAGADQLHAQLTEALKKIEDHKMLDLDAPTVAAFRAEGRAVAAAAYEKKDIGASLDKIRAGDDFDFKSHFYEQGRPLSSAAVAAAYRNNPAMARSAHLGLPATLEAPGFGDALDKTTAELGGRWDKVKAWGRTQMGPKPVDMRGGLAADVELVARAKQLRRRFDEALAREADAPPPAPLTPPLAPHEIQIVVANPDGTPIGFGPAPATPPATPPAASPPGAHLKPLGQRWSASAVDNEFNSMFGNTGAP